jgi:hypothetical protein
MIGKIATESVDRQPLRFDCGVVWDPHAIGEHFVPENIEQEYRRIEVAPRHKPFSDCVGIPDYPTVEPQWLSIHRFCRNLANHNTMS